MKFDGKVCVVTGGAEGIGRCISNAFLNEGAFVAIIDIKKFDETSFPESNSNKIFYYQGDIGDENTLLDFIKKVIKKYEHIDFLINNACISRGGIISGCSFDDFNYVMKIGVIAPYYLSKEFQMLLL